MYKYLANKIAFKKFPWVIYSIICILFLTMPSSLLLSNEIRPTNFPKEFLKRTLKIAVVEQAPFAYRDINNSKWIGISIDIWEYIALSNGLSYEYELVTKDEGLIGIQKGRYDLLIDTHAASPINNVLWFDYSLPYYIGGTSVAFPQTFTDNYEILLDNLLSWTSFKIAIGFIILTILGGMLMLMVEKNYDSPFSQNDFLTRLGTAFWWSGSVTSSVGATDSFPKGLTGRLFGVFWMFISVVLTSVLVGAFASSFTVGQLSSEVKIRDLNKKDILCVQGSDSETFLKEHFIHCRAVLTIKKAMEQLSQKQTQGVVFSDPILSYLSSKAGGLKTIIVPLSFNQYYSFIVPLQSRFLPFLNQEILKMVDSVIWKKLIYNYIGYDPTKRIN